MVNGFGQVREKPFSVSQLTFLIKDHLEPAFPQLWLSGEISNMTRASSGHLYFSLKDQKAQIRATMWRSQAQSLTLTPKDGMEVVVQGSVNVYAPRGEYSLMVNRMEEMGIGRMRAAFERLKAQLMEEGLFAAEHKKSLPFLPRKVGVITSPTGAAIRDIIRVIKKRFSGVHLLIYPARVQGEGAAQEIAQGIETLDGCGCDVLIVGRGGGSEEDLWAFNEVAVARAIFAARTPIISAVGHEVDVTIADLVADVRAATPSHAAELVVKSYGEYHNLVRLLGRSLNESWQKRFLSWQKRLHAMEKHVSFDRLHHRLKDLQRQMVDLDLRLDHSLVSWVELRKRRLERLSARLRLDQIVYQFRALQGDLTRLSDVLDRLAWETVHSVHQRVELARSRLMDLSPRRVLERGFAVVFDTQGRIVRKRDDVTYGDLLRIQLADDGLDARVVALDHAEQRPLFD